MGDPSVLDITDASSGAVSRRRVLIALRSKGGEAVECAVARARAPKVGLSGFGGSRDERRGRSANIGSKGSKGGAASKVGGGGPEKEPDLSFTRGRTTSGDPAT